MWDTVVKWKNNWVGYAEDGVSELEWFGPTIKMASVEDWQCASGWPAALIQFNAQTPNESWKKMQ